jgi:hypothetical protein
MSANSQPTFTGKNLRAIITAMWGACVGFFLTALLLLPGLDALRSRGAAQHGELPEIHALLSGQTVAWQQAVQKNMYVLTCLICPLLAWLSLRLQSRIGGWAGVASVLLFVPAITLVYDGIFQGTPHLGAFATAAVVLGFPFLKVAWLPNRAWNMAPRLNRATELQPTIPPMAAVPDPADFSAAPWKRRLAFGLLLVGILIFFLMPWNIADFADAFTCESHLSSFLIGPSLSLLRPNVVPALDFESHYGLGHMYVFSHFLGDSYHDSLCNYLWFLFAILMFFYFSAYIVLIDFLRSDLMAFLATVVLVAVSMEGLTYRYPSNWPVRFPFLFLFIGYAARPEWLGRPWLPVVLAGFCAGFSLFWQTDVGVFFAAAGVVYYLALSVRERRGWARTPLFLLAAAATFAMLALAAFGPRTLSLLFYQRLFDPLLAYGAGFGFYAMQWKAGWSYLYNVIAPVVTLGTLGFALKQFRAGEAQKQQACYLFLFGTCGLIMVFKWINRAIDPIWSFNAVGIIVVLFWWVRYATGVLAQSLEARTGPQLFGKPVLAVRTLTGSAVIFGLLSGGLIASCFHDRTGVRGFSTSPLVRLKVFTSRTPTLAHLALRKLARLKPEPAVPSPVNARDIELIRANTANTEAVTLFADLDWVYLAEARRAPAFAWVPIYLTYTFPLLDRAEKTVRESETVFVERGSMEKLETAYPDMYQRLYPILRGEFTLVESGQALDMYRRTSANANTRSRKNQ